MARTWGWDRAKINYDSTWPSTDSRLTNLVDNWILGANSQQNNESVQFLWSQHLHSCVYTTWIHPKVSRWSCDALSPGEKNRSVEGEMCMVLPNLLRASAKRESPWIRLQDVQRISSMNQGDTLIPIPLNQHIIWVCQYVPEFRNL